MGYIVAIGGGDNGWGSSQYETQVIDEYIIKLANKKNPRFLFIGFAAKVPEEYFRTMVGIYSKYQCEFKHLDEEACKNGKAGSLIEEADIIYVGGGNTYKLMCKIRNLGIADLLIKAYNNYADKVFCGVSAGAIIWCAKGNSATRFKNGQCTPVCVSGLNILNILYCPHSVRDPFREESTKKMLKRMPGKIGLEIDYAALVVKDGFYSIISLDNRAMARKSYWKSGSYYTKLLKLDENQLVDTLYNLDGRKVEE